MSNNKVEVTKIVIRMGNKDAELTIEQARELKNVLTELLGENKTVYIPQPYVVERPYYPHPYRGVTYTSGTTITCSLTQ